ncbi:hypothetical protein DM01DRAFT_1298731 [Hesseltinella vesiculosa]|uniref:Polysaccharide lyase 14 domain-containing protein n=1 Tax=Hesseltinella vesiculosa TaxID=101127 RepID=A0A1X2GVS9_9FUNG|nr:hypothetical protein DM01DRAFT_1298731 [Hesseltinella vesiculosa]
MLKNYIFTLVILFVCHCILVQGRHGNGSSGGKQSHHHKQHHGGKSGHHHAPKGTQHHGSKTAHQPAEKTPTPSNPGSSGSSGSSLGAHAKSWSFNNWGSGGKAQQKSSGNDQPAWLSQWGSATWSWPWHGPSNYAVVSDPARTSTKGSASVLKVSYPAGSMNPANSPQGGIGFYAHPITMANPTTMELSYSVFFPKGFDFVKGGKFPGLYGGHDQCSDGTKSSACYSLRMMWREQGAGEVYAYFPMQDQISNLCHINGNICNSAYGTSLGRGSFHFKLGAWTNLRQVVQLNTPGKQDGVVTVFANGKQVYQQKQLVFRVASTPKLFGIMFDTFFGGSSSDFITHKAQSTFFKDFSMSVQ